MFNQAKNASKIESTIKKLDKLLAERVVKDETKNVSLGTSKINYNDPRITVAWCKRHEVRQCRSHSYLRHSTRRRRRLSSRRTIWLAFRRVFMPTIDSAQVPVSKPFAKTLMAKFTWAMAVDPDYVF